MKISLYIHIPFCVRKCLYCDFLSGPATRKVQISYIEALCHEIKNRSSKYQEYTVSTVFIGGGTPTSLEAEDLSKIMCCIRENYILEEDAEITIECNPGTVDKDKLVSLRKSGINRISIGLQSANDEFLKKLGRIHSVEDFLLTYRNAHEAGFDNINVDLISALPGQSVEDYKKDLEFLLNLNPGPQHISAYSLIIEEGTPFYQMYEGKEELLPKEDDERKMYYLTEEILSDNGYGHYEISNYSKPGYECRHNVVYWTRKNYLGLGLGAASMVNNVRWKNTDNIEEYLNISDGSSLEKEVEILTKEEQMEEFMFLGLRLIKGISKDNFEKIFNEKFPEYYSDVVKKYVDIDMMMDDGDKVMLTNKGISVSNTILSEFLF